MSLLSLSDLVTVKRAEEQVAEHGGARARRAAAGEPPPVVPEGNGRQSGGQIREREQLAEAHREEAREAAALAARAPVDLIEARVAVAARALTHAAERAAATRLDLGPVGRDLFAVARAVLAVDRALLMLSQDRATAARDSLGAG